MDRRKLNDLVREDRVHRRVYTDPEIFDLEMARLWSRAWIYVGHESQVPEVGCYYTTTVGTRPVVMVRDETDRVRVLHNRCAHKGARIVTRPSGRSSVLRCPYHGWSYHLDGSLAVAPHPTGFEGTGFDRCDPAFHLKPLARSASYGGFVFAQIEDSGVDLETFLGDTRRTLDNVLDRAPEGRVTVVGPGLPYLHECNWKMFVENLNDAVHPMVAHASVGDACRRYMADLSPPEPPPEAQIIDPFGSSYEFFDKMGVTALPCGHSYMGATSSIHTGYSDIPGYHEALVARHGEQKTRAVLSQNRHNTIVYPSFTIKDAIQALRVVRPISVRETLIDTYHLRLEGAPEALLRRTITYSRLINSPASMVGPDDWECYTRMQEALSHDGGDWVYLGRHLHQEHDTNDGLRAPGTSDLSARNQFKAWLEYLTGPETEMTGEARCR